MQQPLTDSEISLLTSIERDWGKLDPMAGGAPAVPRRLFEYGLVARHDNGCLIISDLGKRALFKRRCGTCLSQIEAGTPCVDADALNWLERSGFISSTQEQGAQHYSITARGKLWRAA